MGKYVKNLGEGKEWMRAGKEGGRVEESEELKRKGEEKGEREEGRWTG